MQVFGYISKVFLSKCLKLGSKKDPSPDLH